MANAQASELKGQTALVTGATGGIGRAICHSLASLGCNIIIHYLSSTAEAEQLQADLRNQYGVDAYTLQADLGDYDDVRHLHSYCAASHQPTILINNAGANGGHSGTTSISEVPIEDFEKTWRINCGSAYLLTQLCMPFMEEQGFGRVIFISSVAGFTGGVVGPHYASSKSALHGLIHWLAGAYAKKGITVNGVAPALIEQTKMLPGSNEELAKKIPLGRLGMPEEVANTVKWMVTTPYVTNKVVGVDGGMFPQ
ncbi:putative short-chain dehydrogenase/reductase [Lophiotrema nucula]|uniref:3-oxoacyl-[acyl-carrier-protein] reductase n=1 Tax=Lophiotrema nucula TaxID=690887 RepID=A0A6A5Z6H6_9PLEO|nr:putative short-chain dehydrogenase/reductase [Lophiotrema nucula]